MCFILSFILKLTYIDVMENCTLPKRLRFLNIPIFVPERINYTTSVRSKVWCSEDRGLWLQQFVSKNSFIIIFSKYLTDLHMCGIESAEWPDLTKKIPPRLLPFWTYFSKFEMLLGKFSLPKVDKYRRNNLAIWSHWIWHLGYEIVCNKMIKLYSLAQDLTSKVGN